MEDPMTDREKHITKAVDSGSTVFLMLCLIGWVLWCDTVSSAWGFALGVAMFNAVACIYHVVHIVRGAP
jgi:hypothetical protein